MQLPLEITPNPLITSSVELRFESTISRDRLLGSVYPILFSELPNLTYGEIPIEVKSEDEQLKYTPDFTLSNDKYQIGFTPNSFLFENSNSYQLWGSYFQFIKDQLLKISSLNFVTKITRVGLRYVSIFPDNLPLDKCLKFYPKIEGLNDYQNQRIRAISTLLEKGPIKIHLQISPKAQAERKGTMSIGFLIDIDCHSTSYKGKIDENLLGLIDELHNTEKQLFFNLLSSEFLASLNPKY